MCKAKKPTPFVWDDITVWHPIIMACYSVIMVLFLRLFFYLAIRLHAEVPVFGQARSRRCLNNLASDQSGVSWTVCCDFFCINLFKMQSEFSIMNHLLVQRPKYSSDLQFENFGGSEPQP